MVPRGRLDISAGQLWWALFACLRNHSSELLAHSIQSRWSGWHVLPVLSVRTAWDAFLAAQQWPPGDEILMSAVTIPDMVRIVREHRLVPVPVPVQFNSLAVLPDELARRITPRTRAAIVAHLFGCRMAIAPLAAVTRRAGILLMEDAAQSFTGILSVESTPSDVVLLSFGPIKTCTALGGGLALLKDDQLAQGLARRLASYADQSNSEFALRLMKFACIHALACPPLFTALQWLFSCCRLDLDGLLSSLTRGFAGGSFWNRLRRRPATALVALLERRLRTFDPKAVADRRGRAERLWNLLPAAERPGAAATDHTQWVLPVASPDPQQLVRQLRARGYDASQRASSLELFEDHPIPTNSSWNRLVYLPHHPQMVPDQLAAIAAPLLVSK